MKNPELSSFPIPPEIKKTLYAGKKMIPLNRAKGLPTTAAVNIDRSTSAIEQIMSEGPLSTDCSVRLSGKAAGGVDNFYNGSNVDVFPGPFEQ